MKKITKNIIILMIFFSVGLSFTNAQSIHKIESDGTFYSIGDTVVLNRFNYQNDFKFKVGTKNVDNLRAWVIFDGHDDLKIDKDLKNTTGINSVLEFDINFNYQQILTQTEGFIFTVKFYWKYDSENWHILRENDKLLDSGVIHLKVDNIDNYKNYVKLEAYTLDSLDEKVYDLNCCDLGSHKLSILPISNSLFNIIGTNFEIVADYTGYYTTLEPNTDDFKMVYTFPEPILEENELILDYNREEYRRFLTYSFYCNDGTDRYLLGVSNTINILPNRLDNIIDSLEGSLNTDVFVKLDLPIILKENECENQSDIILGSFIANLIFNHKADEHNPIITDYRSDLLCSQLDLVPRKYNVLLYVDSSDVFSDLLISSDTTIHLNIEYENYIHPETVNIRIVFDNDTIFSSIPSLLSENDDCKFFGKKVSISDNWKDIVKTCVDEDRINEYIIHSLDGSTDGKYDKETFNNFTAKKQPFILVVRYDYNKFGFIMFI